MATAKFLGRLFLGLLFIVVLGKTIDAGQLSSAAKSIIGFLAVGLVITFANLDRYR